MRFLQRCPNEQHKRFRHHWTSASQERCDALFRGSILTVSDRTDWPDDMSWLERSMQEREEQKAAAALSSYVQQYPTDRNETVLNRNGERQLLGLHEWHSVVGLLLTNDVYGLNRCLRTGAPLHGEPGPMMDWNGYVSYQQFVDDARKVFSTLGSSLELDEPITAFRGLGMPPATDRISSDIWGIREHLDSGEPWHTTVVEDRGFAFATPSEPTAHHYDGADFHNVDPEWLIICTMEIRRGLCVPDQIYRTPRLRSHLYADHYLRGADGQVIIPPLARWRITEVVPDFEIKTVRIRMHQVL
ncbi:hypothetical protein [Microbacterium gorillae]|uniref:hypothetical protein n=1 Tax=Microbacterium gorillae TaxID=1231063 RepID=UPI003D9817C2